MDNRTLSAAQITAHCNETFGGIASFGARVTMVPAHAVTIND